MASMANENVWRINTMASMAAIMVINASITSGVILAKSENILMA
jgi:hypothetical protein